MNAANYITVGEFQTMNPETDFSQYQTTTLSGMISRASANMDNYLQFSLGVEDISQEATEAMVSPRGNLIIYTRKAPIVSVSAIRLKLGTVHLDLNLTDSAGNARYDIPARARSITYPYQEIAMTGVFSVRNFFQLRQYELFALVSYRAGYETIPQDLKDACNLWAKDIFIRQANPMDLSAANQGAISMTYKNRGGQNSEDSKWVQEAKQILNSYKRITG